MKNNQICVALSDDVYGKLQMLRDKYNEPVSYFVREALFLLMGKEPYKTDLATVELDLD